MLETTKPKEEKKMINENAIEGLEPKNCWKYLAEIAEIPRGSGNEEGVRNYVLSIAERFGLEAKTDKVGNVLVKKPATAGREKVPSAALQGHLDMVNEKNNDVVHDFLKDPIRFARKDDIMKASGTTAGFDNGIAVASMCAIMEDTTLAHGPLEMLFTVDEETGLTGANGLESGFITSKTLLNLDTEEEGQLYIGCAGGRQITASVSYPRIKPPENFIPCTIHVSGLPGGHSGCQIHEEKRGNALKILGKTLRSVCEENEVFLSSVSGGDKHNAIPREAVAVIFVPKDQVESIERKVKDELIGFAKKYGETEQSLSLNVEKMETVAEQGVLDKDEQERLINLLVHLTNGVVKMSEAVPGLVETSTNLAAVTFENGKFMVVTSQRSSVSSELEKICDTVADFLTEAKMEVERGEGYPGWEPNPKSPILLKAVEVYESLYGITPQVKAIHAGLECGVIGEKYPGMDMLSIGPTIENPHSPDELMHISTVPKFWNFLVTLLASIK